MCDKNGFTSIREVDFDIIINLWLPKKHMNWTEMKETKKLAIVTMINLYNTCHYFQNLLDDPSYFQQFQDKIGYKMFDLFANINSLNNMIGCRPISIKNGNDILTKLVPGNIVSIPGLNKNYRIVESSDCHGTMIEIDHKDVVINNKIIEIFSETVDIRCDNYKCIAQKWRPFTYNYYISNQYIIGKTKCGLYFYIAGIDESFIREFVPR
jgi:hypothetical protein